MRGRSQCRLCWAALVILIGGHDGSEMRIQVWPVCSDMTGKSVFQWMGLLPSSFTRDLSGMLIPVISRATTARESRQCKKAGRILGAIEKLAPGGLFSSL